MVSPGGHVFRIVGLKQNPFEAQGEFDPAISLEVKKFRTEQVKECRDLIEKASSEGKIQVAVIWGPVGSGKTHLIHRLAESESFSTVTKHIVLKMQIGPPDDHLFLLTLIVEKLRDAVNGLPNDQVETFRDTLSSDFPEFKKTDVPLPQEDYRRATRLLNEWFTSVKTIIEVGKFRNVAIYMDEVEDRWASTAFSSLQRENDLKLLRDLIGFVQEERQVSGAFPVALFLSMTTETYQQIGKENSALQNRLARIVALPAWTESEAKQLAEERIKAARLPGARERGAEPFTYDALDEIASLCRTPEGFNLRRFLVLMSDSLYSFARARLMDPGRPSIMNRPLARELVGPKKTTYEEIDHRKGIPSASSLPPAAQDIFDLAIAKNPESQAKWSRLKTALVGNQDAQLDRAVQNVIRLLREISPDLVDPGDFPNKARIKISGQEGVVPVSVVGDGDFDSAKGDFQIIATLESIAKPISGGFYLRLPKERLLQLALLSEPDIVPEPEVKSLAESLKDDATRLLTSVTNYFNENKRKRYIPYVVPTTPPRRREFLDGLIEVRVKGSTKASLKGKLIDADLVDGAKVKDPYWMPLVLQAGDLSSPDRIREKYFVLNRDSGPIRGAIGLIQDLAIVKGAQKQSVRTVREDLTSLMADEEERIDDWLGQVQVQDEAGNVGWIEDIVKAQKAALNDVQSVLKKLHEDPSCELASYLDIYAVRLRIQSLSRDSEGQRQAIIGSFERYRAVRRAITQRQEELLKCRFVDRSIAQQLGEIQGQVEKAMAEGRTDDLDVLDQRLYALNETIGMTIRTNQDLEQRLSRVNSRVILAAIDFGYDQATREAFQSLVHAQEKASRIEEASNAIEELELVWANLRNGADKRRQELTQRFENTSRALSQVQSLLGGKSTHEAEEELRQFRVDWGVVYQKYQAGDLSAVFDPKLEEKLRVVAETLSKILEPDRVYGSEDLAQAFGLDKDQATDVAEILARLGILERAYRVSKMR